MPTDITLAIAGHAPNTKRNIEYLISDWLRLGTPDDEGYYAKPDRYSSVTVYLLMTDGQVPLGIKDAANLLLSVAGTEVHLVTDSVTGDIIKWSDYVDDVAEVGDPIEYLISKLASAPSARLLMNWDEEDADDDQLIKLAHQHQQIRVLDLVEGLGAIVPDDDPEPEPEPEEEPEQPVSRTRKREKSKQEELEEPREALEEEPPPASTPEKLVRETRETPQVSTPSTLEEDVAAAKRSQTTLPLADVTIPTETLAVAHKALDKAGGYLIGIDQGNALKNLASEAIPSPLTLFVVEAAEALRAILYAEVPYEKSLPQSEKPTPASKAGRVIWDEGTSEWKRAGRGRVRAGTRTGMMDADGNVTEAA